MSEFEGLSSLCLFGGTFDPIHLGHLVIAERALEFCGAERVVFLPSSSPPHKRPPARAPRAGFDHRMAMADLAIRDNPRFRVSDREGRRAGASYTVDLLREVKAEMTQDSQVYFLVGADWVSGLATWKEIDEIFGLCRFIVAPRPGHARAKVRAAAGSLGKEKAELLWKGWIPAPEIGISSSEIRERVASGLPVRYLLPPGVEEYIHANGLYLG